MNSIRYIAPNDSGLCSLSLMSHLAFPTSNECGELQIYDVEHMQVRLKIKAHDSPLSAFNFSPSGTLLATASEKGKSNKHRRRQTTEHDLICFAGTVIRVFCVRNGRKVHEFRRGMKRCVRIASLTFSSCSNFVCVSSNTETVHIFKIDLKMVEEAERQGCISSDGSSGSTSDSTGSTSSGNSVEESGTNRWSMGYLTKAMTSYLPSPVSDVLTQDRSFATVQLGQAGLRYQCVVTKLEKQTKILAACEDGFLYVYDLDTGKGGECKLIRAHDLRSPLDGITGRRWPSRSRDRSLIGDFEVAEISMEDKSCDKIVPTPEKKIVPATIGSYASVLKGRERNKMSGWYPRKPRHIDETSPLNNSHFDYRFRQIPRPL